MDEIITAADLDGGDSTDEMVSRWKSELDLAKKNFSKWNERSEKIVKRYRDERGSMSEYSFTNTNARYNIFWSNVQTQLPALYARTPRVEVERRFKDADNLGRLSATVLERATDFQIKDFDFDLPMVSALTDLLLVGRGVCRVRYLPTFVPEYGVGGEVFEILASEKVVSEYVFWKDFFHSTARCWDDVKWVAFRSYLTKEELKERFGQEVADEVPMNYTPAMDDSKFDDDKKEHCKKAEIFEIWNKGDKKVYWISKAWDKPLDVKEDPLGLKDFFPCPRPIYATMTTDRLEPVADFVQYMDQANELDVITARIVTLTEALRVAGIYDGSCEVLQRLLSEGTENKLLPEPNWAGLVQQGGLEGAIYFLPTEPIVSVLKRLYEARGQVIESIYQITGLSDIIRGFSNPNETAAAQQIKGQFGTLRVATRQADVQRFARDLISLMAEVVAEHFSVDSIIQMSGYQFMTGTIPEDPTEIDAIVQLLRDDPQRTFRIDIETDSTLAINEQADQAARTQYLNAVGSFMQSMGPLVQSLPEFAPMVGEMLRLTARTFKAGRTLEGVLENAISQMMARLNAPPEEAAPDPKMIEAQTKQQLAEMKMQLDQEKLMFKQQLDAQKLQSKEMLEMSKLESKIQLEQYKAEMTGQVQMEKIRAESAISQMELSEKVKADTVNAMIKMEGQQEKAAPAPAAAPQAPVDITVSLAQPRRKVILGAPDIMGNRVGEIIDIPTVEADGE